MSDAMHGAGQWAALAFCAVVLAAAIAGLITDWRRTGARFARLTEPTPTEAEKIRAALDTELEALADATRERCDPDPDIAAWENEVSDR